MPRHHACLELCGVALVVALSVACSNGVSSDSTRALLTTPSAATLVAASDVPGDQARTLAQVVATFTLVNGIFTLTSPAGTVNGTYGGLVQVPVSGRSTAALTLVVTGGSDMFAGATGTLVGTGGGAFVADGDFNLSVDGMVSTTARPAGSRLRINVSGIATLPFSCSDNDRRFSRLVGIGTIPNVGRSRMELQSEILETSCF